MNSISRTWRRISSQLKTNLSRKRSTSSANSNKSYSSNRSANTKGKSVRFYAVDTVYYTHSSTEYDRTPSDEDLMSHYASDDDDESFDLDYYS
jgi:hypothetical protein